MSSAPGPRGGVTASAGNSLLVERARDFLAAGPADAPPPPTAEPEDAATEPADIASSAAA